MIGYLLVGSALVLFVQAGNVYPQLLLARMSFALGAAACTTMVTAILPCISFGEAGRITHSISPAQAEDIIAVTPSNWSEQMEDSDKTLKTWYQIPGARLAGFVGTFTGLGALIALTCFLPLPSLFQKHQSTPANALKKTYYIVSIIAFLASLICFFGLRNLKDQQDKSWSKISPSTKSRPLDRKPTIPYKQLFYQSVRAGLNPDIGLGYIGGFVARASSVGISSFIPLLANNYFISTGRCKLDDTALVKTQCREAYILAAKLTGVSQFVALLLAPAFGYFSDNKQQKLHIPLLLAATAGIIGYTALSFFTHSPDPADPEGSSWIYLWVSLIGTSQIGAIVCSLGCLAQGITSTSLHSPSSDINTNFNDPDSAPLLSSFSQPVLNETREDLKNLQGSIAGTYSLAGGIAILLLTKIGGVLFDTISVAAPFVILLVFNTVLLCAVLGHGRLGGRGRIRRDGGT